MKLIKYLGFVMILLFSLNVVSADIVTGNLTYTSYDGNNATDITGNGNDGVNTVITYDTGILGNASVFNGASSFITYPSALIDYSEDTINFWFNSSASESSVQHLWNDRTDTDTFLRFTAADELAIAIRSGAGFTTSTTFRDDSWHMATIVFGTTTFEMFIDGRSEGTGSIGAAAIDGGSLLGKRSNNLLFYDGLIDEFSMYDREWSGSDVNESYNNGTGFNPFIFIPPGDPVITFDNISLTNNSIFNTNSINVTINLSVQNTNNQTNVSYNLDGAGLVSCFNESLNGICTINSLTDGIHNVSFFAINNETNTTSSQFNFTIDLTAPTITDSLAVNRTEPFFRLTNETNTYSFSSRNNICSPGIPSPICPAIISTCLDDNIDFCKIQYESSNFTLLANEFSVASTFNVTFNGNLSYTIFAQDLAGNSLSKSGEFLVNPIQRFNFFDASNLTQISNYDFGGVSFTNQATFFTFNDIISFGNNSFLFEKLGYATTNITFNINSTTDLNLSINITRSTIIVNIFDRDTLALLTGLTELTLVPPLGGLGVNTTTTTGIVNISEINFLSGNYQIISNHLNYSTESVFFTYNNQELLNIDIFMLADNTTGAGFVIIKAVSDSGPLIQQAICKALEWVPSQSAFVTVAQGLTDGNGETILNIEVGTKLYKFTCEKAGQLVTSPQQIIQATGVTIPLTFITVEEAPPINLEQFRGNLTNVTINSSFQQIIYDFNDPLGTVTEACIKVYQTTGIQKILLSETCSASSTGQIQIVLNINNSFNLQVEATAGIGSTEIVVDILKFGKIGNFEQALKAFGLHLVLPILLLCLGLSLGLMVDPPSIMISGIGGIAGVWFAGLILPSIISFSIAIFISIILILMIIGSDKKK